MAELRRGSLLKLCASKQQWPTAEQGMRSLADSLCRRIGRWLLSPACCCHILGPFCAKPLPRLFTPSSPNPLPASCLQYKLLHYSHPDADLASTELQALQGKAPSAQVQRAVDAAAAAAAAGLQQGAEAEASGQGQMQEGEQEQKQEQGPQAGEYLGLRLSFTLPASCYATMLIRELTKQPTSVAHHKALPHGQQGAAGPQGAAEKKAAAEQQPAGEQAAVAEQKVDA